MTLVGDGGVCLPHCPYIYRLVVWWLSPFLTFHLVSCCLSKHSHIFLPLSVFRLCCGVGRVSVAMYPVLYFLHPEGAQWWLWALLPAWHPQAWSRDAGSTWASFLLIIGDQSFLYGTGRAPPQERAAVIEYFCSGQWCCNMQHVDKEWGYSLTLGVDRGRFRARTTTTCTHCDIPPNLSSSYTPQQARPGQTLMPRRTQALKKW